MKIFNVLEMIWNVISTILTHTYFIIDIIVRLFLATVIIFVFAAVKIKLPTFFIIILVIWFLEPLFWKFKGIYEEIKLQHILNKSGGRRR